MELGYLRFGEASSSERRTKHWGHGARLKEGHAYCENLLCPGDQPCVKGNTNSGAAVSRLGVMMSIHLGLRHYVEARRSASLLKPFHRQQFLDKLAEALRRSLTGPWHRPNMAVIYHYEVWMRLASVWNAKGLAGIRYTKTRPLWQR